MTGRSSSAESSAAATRRATLIGASAIVLWATLAVLTTLTTAVPPLLMTAGSFGIASVAGLIAYRLRGHSVSQLLRQPARVWSITVGGLFGYHTLLFAALRLAPAVEANLINYLWPLCIVLFATSLPGHKLRWHHLTGVALGLAGTVLIVGGPALSLKTQFALGYLLALGAAVTWGAYSVMSRRFCSATPSDFVFAACGVTAVLALACHALVEPSMRPTGNHWLLMACLGLGPLGLAFRLWDIGCKRGDIRVLGATAYTTPLLSTLLLVLAGRATLTWTLTLGGLLIVGGAMTAGKELWARLREPG